MYFQIQISNDPSFISLNGEKLQDVKNEVTYICPHQGPSRGTLTITNYRLHFKSQPTNEKESTCLIVDVPLGVVSIKLILEDVKWCTNSIL